MWMMTTSLSSKDPTAWPPAAPFKTSKTAKTKERPAAKLNSQPPVELSSVVAQLMKRQDAMEAANTAAMATMQATMQQIQQSIRSFAPVVANANKRKRADQENTEDSPPKSARRTVKSTASHVQLDKENVVENVVAQDHDCLEIAGG